MITALNLKYRPQKISDLDHKSAREALIKIFSGGKIPSAFLFSGPKGIGKTSAARIVAKTVNCEKVSREAKVSRVPREYEPCNECSTCVSITNGSNLDVFEIDAASNRGIDDIRELREKIRLSPSSAKYKVYIIDEVHMLTNEAFNALLKTLEEPPEHAIFILCTTAPEKLPETIISRCTRINFKKASSQEIVEKLKKISQAEKFEFKEDDLIKIVKAADGSFRDAIKILEQAASSSVNEVLGVVIGFKPEELLSLIVQIKTKEAIIWLNKAVEQGVNLRILTEGLLEVLRLELLKKYGVVDEEEAFAEVEELKKATPEEIRFLIDLFTKAALDLRTTVIPQLPLEMAVIAFAEGEVKSEKPARQASPGETGGLKVKSEDNEGNAKIDSEAGSEKREVGGESDKSKLQSQSQSSSLTSRPVSHFSPSPQLSEILAKWPEILAKVKPLNHSIQAFLKACRPINIEEEFLVLEVFYKFHKDQLESDKCRKIVEQVCGEVLNSEVKIKYILGEKPKSSPPSLSTHQEANSEMITVEVETKNDLPNNDDLVKMAEEIFNGGIVH